MRPSVRTVRSVQISRRPPAYIPAHTPVHTPVHTPALLPGNYPSTSRPTNLFSNDLNESFLCGICLDVMSEPFDTPCGHTFCFGCVKVSLHRKKECPKCRSPMTDVQPASFAFKSLLFSQNTFCDRRALSVNNEPFSCDWYGKWEHLNAHLRDECPLTEVGCNACGESVRRGLLQEHKETACLGSIIQCSFSRVGCPFESPRRGMPLHLATEKVFHQRLHSEQAVETPVVTDVLTTTTTTTTTTTASPNPTPELHGTNSASIPDNVVQISQKRPISHILLSVFFCFCFLLFSVLDKKLH
eukprot:TRINITY_DN5693_c0_g1_i1.p1 TRINITY_DN5693_c0_g1~~TRINITY_DN5693_c0_g1_i1.p1  ORF type:complete len:299 (+),score=22.57 TRINITY_DN5693_c0_g1_i1:294-1190(+)